MLSTSNTCNFSENSYESFCISKAAPEKVLFNKEMTNIFVMTL